MDGDHGKRVPWVGSIPEGSSNLNLKSQLMFCNAHLDQGPIITLGMTRTKIYSPIHVPQASAQRHWFYQTSQYSAARVVDTGTPPATGKAKEGESNTHMR